MKTRRVVTGHNKDGRSVVKRDTEIESKPGLDSFEKVDLWATDSLPARLTKDDPTQWNLGTSLANGSVNWFNRGTQPCVIAAILIATEGGVSTGW